MSRRVAWQIITDVSEDQNQGQKLPSQNTLTFIGIAVTASNPTTGPGHVVSIMNKVVVGMSVCVLRVRRLPLPVLIPPSIYPWLYSPSGPWPLYLFSRWDSLDGGSACRKAAIYTQNNTNRINAQADPCIERNSNPRSQFMP
jgi:hypothetical protein